MNTLSVRLLALVVCCGILASCATAGKKRSSYSQAQLNAIETREIDADLDETFEAALNAVLDAGYTISVSEKDSGLITGTRSEDKTVERIWISPWIKDESHVVTVKLRRLDDKLTSARVTMSINGEAKVDKEDIDNIWHLMQRQVLMKEPPTFDEPEKSTTTKSKSRRLR